MIIEILATIGLCLSLYAYSITWKFDHKKKSKPFCDINSKISCSKSFNSKYGKKFGIPNSLFGILFYLFLLFLPQYSFYLGVIAVLTSVYLGYISYVIQKNLCIICSATYLVNILILVFSI